MTKGFSLLEFMIVMALFAIIGAGLLTVLHQGQIAFQVEDEKTVATESARMAMDQIVRYLRQAGNDPTRYMELNDIDAIELTPGQVRLRSDITGSVASTTTNPAEKSGDPDGALDSIHEDVWIQLVGSQLRIDVGYGMETLAEDIAQFNISFFDKWGNPTSIPQDALKAKVQLVTNAHLSLSSDIFLKRSSYYQLFAGD